MSERVLIVRTISVEELGPLVEICRSTWRGANICVLTSPNRHREVAGIAGVDETIDYLEATGGFGMPWNDGRAYRALVIPVRNGSGWGYANVARALSTVNAASVRIAQWGRALKPVTLTGLELRSRVERGVRSACAAPAHILGHLFLAHARPREITR